MTKIAVIEVDGKPVELEFPDETTDDVMSRAVKDYVIQNGSLSDKIKAFESIVPPSPQEVVADTALTVGQGLAGLTAGGVAGTTRAAFGGDVDQVTSAIENVSDLISRAPKTDEANAIVNGIGYVFEHGVRLLQGVLGEANTQIAAAEDTTGQEPPPLGETFMDVQREGAGNAMIDRGFSPGQATAVDTTTNALLFGLPGRILKTKPKTGGGILEPKPAPNTAVNPADTTRARQLVSGALEADEVLLRGQSGKLAELGPEGRIADVGDANLRNLTKIATQVTKEGRAIGDANFGTRLREVRTKAGSFIREKLTQGRSFIKEQERIMEESKTAADKHYKNFYASKIDNTTPQMLEVLKDPNILDSMPKAKKRILQDTSVPAAERAGLTQKAPSQNVIVTADSVGGTVKPPASVAQPKFDPTPRFWDSVKKRLSARIMKAQKTDPDLFRILSNSQKNLVAELKRQSGEYGKAMDIWSDRSSALTALETGRQTFSNFGKSKEGIEFTKQQFDALSAIDKQLYRIAGGEKMIDNLNAIKDTATSGSPPSSISHFSGSPASRELLSTIFEKPGDLAEFEAFVARERTFAQTNKTAQTTDAERMRLQERLASKPIRAHIAAISTDVLFAMNQNRFATLRLVDNVLGSKSRRITPGTLNEVARIVAEPAFRAELNEIARLNGEIPKNLRPMMKMDNEALSKWMMSKPNRRALAEFGVRAIIIEQAMNQEAQ